MREYREITAEDVERSLIRAFGRTWQTSSFIGRILPGDVGKRIYLTGEEVLKVENDEQRSRRIAQETK